MIDYQLIRSKRKTVGLYVKEDGSLEVRASYFISRRSIEDLIARKEHWIETTREEMKRRKEQQSCISLDSVQVKVAKEEAKRIFSDKCAYFAAIIGVDYCKVKVNGAKTRWGSCTSKGNLNFNYRLIFAKEEVIDYIVVHELAHRREMNHSPRFWAIVEEVLPDYKKRRRELREFQRNTVILEKGDIHEKQQGIF